MSAASIIVALDPETLDELRALARFERITLGDLLREAVADYLSRVDRKPVDRKPVDDDNQIR